MLPGEESQWAPGTVEKLLKLADKLHSLHDATKVKGQTIEWTSECQSAFLAGKSTLATVTNASNRAVGGQPWYETVVVVDHAEEVLETGLVAGHREVIHCICGFLLIRSEAVWASTHVLAKNALLLVDGPSHFHRGDGRPDGGALRAPVRCGWQ